MHPTLPWIKTQNESIPVAHDMGDNFRHFFQLLKLLFWFTSNPLPEQSIELSAKPASNRHFLLKIFTLDSTKRAKTTLSKASARHYASSCWKLSSSSPRPAERSPRGWLPLGPDAQHSRSKRRRIDPPSRQLPAPSHTAAANPQEEPSGERETAASLRQLPRQAKTSGSTLHERFWSIFSEKWKDVKNKSNMSVCPPGPSLHALVGTGFMLHSQGCSHLVLCCTAAFHYSLP